MKPMLDEQEIDEWFEAEKERLSSELMKDLQKNVDLMARRKQFDADFEKLIVVYHHRYDQAEKITSQRKKRREFVERIVAWRRRKRHYLKVWWELKKERWKKWRFEREYKKLFPHKEREI